MIFIKTMTLKNGRPTLIKINLGTKLSVKIGETEMHTGHNKRMIMEPSLTSSPIIKDESSIVRIGLTKHDEIEEVIYATEAP